VIAPVVLGLAAGAAGLVYDSDATAAAPKRVALLLLALATTVFARGDPRRPAPAMLAWLGFTGWMACTLAWGTTAGRPEAIGWTAAAALALSALTLPAASVKDAARLAATVLGGGASTWAVLEWLAGARGIRITGGQGNPDWLAIAIAVALPCSLEWVGRRARRRWPLLLVEMLGLACARSRTAWMAAFVVVLILHGDAWWRTWPRRLVAIAASASAFAIAGTWPALVGRAWIWRWSWAVAVRHLPFGCGLGGFTNAFAAEQAVALRAMSPALAEHQFVLTPSAHDDWLQALAEGGLPALLLLAAVLGLAVRAHLSEGWRAGTATLLAIGVAALGDSPLRSPAVLAILALVVAACPSPTHPVGWRSPAMLALTAAALACALPWWWAERLTTQARRADAPTRALLVVRAAALDPGSPSVAFEQGLASIALGNPSAAIPCFERARSASWQIAQDVAIGNAWLELGDTTAAADSYARALTLAPGSVRARLSLADARRREGRLEEAAQLLAQARHQRPSGTAVRLLSSRLEDVKMDACSQSPSRTTPISW
jgi:tetratricopeptide (TPR) repeat protein